ncbi:MAG TPA: tRNA (guanosine(37)-N1)-methyltransferase TrmD [Chlamydiales bacterium]|nr:tRNA (guanosine(37)-N1)-methyltransferase TrmD [Chlamydiales bacterium]
MRFCLLSLFPEYFQGPFDVSILKRAREKGLIDIELIDIRDFSKERHKKVDDKPFGGGPGMVLAPQAVCDAIKSAKRESSKVIYLSPQGRPLTSPLCEELAKENDLVLLCGHYEGIDERIIEKYVDQEISIGDYVLTNGCAAAIVLLDAVIRFIPGVIGDPESVKNDSFQEGLFDAPQYTRPQEYDGMKVPEVLVNGNHAEIEKWRKNQRLEKTRIVRPDLYERFIKN